MSPEQLQKAHRRGLPEAATTDPTNVHSKSSLRHSPFPPFDPTGDQSYAQMCTSTLLVPSEKREGGQEGVPAFFLS
jgi:hypothetical protein